MIGLILKIMMRLRMRMHDVGSKVLIEIKRPCVNSLALVRIEGGEREDFQNQ